MNRRSKQTNEIYEIGFQLNVIDAKISVRFPCTFFIALRNNGNKMIVRTSKDDIASKQGVALFKQSLAFKTYLIYDPQQQSFLHKQTTLGLYLISQRKPGQQKLVGRIKIDLGDITNENNFETQVQHKLEFSSIKDASVTFSMKILSKEKTDLAVNQLDMDSFSHLEISARDIAIDSEMMKNRSGVEDVQKNSKVSDHRSAKQSNIQAIQDEIAHIREQKTKLQVQNLRLLEIIEKNNLSLQNFQAKQCSEVTEEVHLLKARINQIETEKNTIVEQLMTQIQQETKSRIELQNQLNEINQKQGEAQSQQLLILKDTILRLEAELEESQKTRLQVQTENLEIKFQLSEVKALQEQYITTLEEKQQKINQIIQKDASEHAKHLASGSQQLRELNTENENLRQKIQQLKQQIQCAEAGVTRIDEVSQAYTNLLTEYDAVTLKLNEITLEKEKIQEEKRQLEQKILKPGESDIHSDQLTKNLLNIQSEVQRLREQIAAHEEFKQKSEQSFRNLEQELNDTLQKLKIEKQENAQHLEQITNQNEEIKFLKENLQNLQAQLHNAQKTLHHQKKHSGHQISQLSLKLKNLQNYINERDNEIQEQRSQIKDQNKEIRTANDTIKQLELQIKILEGQIKQNQKIKEEGIDVINDLKDQVSELNKLRTEYINKEMKQNNQMNSLKNKIQKAIKDSKTKQATISQKNIIIDHLNRQIEDEIRKTQELEERINKFAEKEIQMRENIFVLEEESKKIYDIVVEQENVLESQDGELGEKDEEIAVLKSQNIQLYERNAKLQQINNNLSKQNYQLKNNVIQKLPVLQSSQTPGELFSADQKQKKLLSNQQSRISQLQKVLEDKNQDTVKKINQFKQHIQLLQEQKKKLQEKVIQLNQQKGQSKKEKDELSEKIRKQEFSIDQLNLKVQNMCDEMGSNKGSQIRELELKKEEYHFLQNKNEALMSEMQTLEKRISDQNKEIEDYIGRIQELQMSKAEEGESVPNTVNLINERNLNRENESLKKSIAEMEANNLKMAKQISNLEEQIKSGVLIAKEPQKGLDISNTSLASTISSTSKELKALINQRTSRTKSEQAIQILVNNNKMLEDGMGKIIEQRGMIQENARKLSLQFQKIKANLLKSKANMQDKRQLLNTLKPCEEKVKELISMAQNLSEFINMMEEPVDE